jgi:hypothetical protein
MSLKKKLIIDNIKITGCYNVVWGINIILFDCVMDSSLMLGFFVGNNNNSIAN